MSLDHPGLTPTEADSGDPTVADGPAPGDRAPDASGNGDHTQRWRRSQKVPKPPKPRRARAGGRRARKVQRIVRRVEPWSVLKISLVFYFCLFLILLVAGVLLWSAGRSAGVIDDFEGFISDVGLGARCQPLSELAPGTEYVRDGDCLLQGDDYVLTGGRFEFEDRTLLYAIALGGFVLVIAGSIANLLLAVLFNLISEITGGVRMTVLQMERQPGADLAPGSSVPGSSVPGPGG
jgi:hypothetical protein